MVIIRAPKKLPRREGLKDPVIPAAPQLITKTIAEPTAQEKIDDMKREAEGKIHLCANLLHRRAEENGPKISELILDPGFTRWGP